MTDSTNLTDPRKVRSRNRLLDAATSLLTAGGIEAVTIDAVVRLSKVARTTLYRHFDSSTQLIAATFERLIPPNPAPTSGPLRDRLIELLSRQATLINEAPLQMTMLAWMAVGPAKPAAKDPALDSLRNRILDQYRAPYDQVLGTPEAADELGDYDADLALLQLIGPIVLGKLAGIKQLDHADCVHLLDDFLAARRR